MQREAMNRQSQLKILTEAKKRVIANFAKSSAPLHNIEFVVPFVELDTSLDVVIFYPKDEDLMDHLKTGKNKEVEDFLKAQLIELGYEKSWIEKISAKHDSFENVQRNFEGSYFYRMR